MQKCDNITNYYSCNKAMFLYFYDLTHESNILGKYTISKDCICGAQMGTIFSILLSLKEELISKETSESKLLDKCLERCVDMIATKTVSGYKIGDYVSPDAITLVSVIRNKIAHGEYVIDFGNKSVILFDEDKKIILSVNSLSKFVIAGIAMKLNFDNSSVYERDITYFNNKQKEREKPLKCKSEVKNVIKKSKNIHITIRSKDGSPIGMANKVTFEHYIEKFKKTNDVKVFNELENKLNKNNCILERKTEYLKEEEKVNNLINYITNSTNFEELDYQKQLELIGKEVHRIMNPKYNEIELKTCNFYILQILEQMNEMGTTDFKTISDAVCEKYTKIYINYDVLASGTINMFNALFSYCLDDLYNDRTNGLDYETLNLNDVKLLYFKKSNTYIEAENKYNCSEASYKSIKKQHDKVLNNLMIQQSKGDTSSVLRISELEKILSNKLEEQDKKRQESKREFEALKTYYENNCLFTRNKAIINGIRNSIAHGNYEVVCDGDFNDAKIIFSDIYKGELTFKAEILVLNFFNTLDSNYQIINKYIADKKIKYEDEEEMPVKKQSKFKKILSKIKRNY